MDTDNQINTTPSFENKFYIFLLIGIISFLIIGILIFNNYYFKQNSIDSPPSLSSQQSLFQGLIKTSKGFLSVTDEDVQNFLGFNFLNCSPVEMPAGTHYYYLKKDLTVGEIFNRIEPIVGNKLLVAFYSPGESSLGLNEAYYTYPEGQFDTINLMDWNQKIPAYRGFALIMKHASRGCLEKTSSVPSEFHSFLSDQESGWILTPVPNCGLIESFRTKINQLWAQNGDNSFAFVDSQNYANECKNPGFNLVWIEWGHGSSSLDKIVYLSSIGSGSVFYDPTIEGRLLFRFTPDRAGNFIFTIIGPNESVVYSEDITITDQLVGQEMEIIWDGFVDGEKGDPGLHNFLFLEED
ncbi:hypothetical protein ACFL21_04300 [Patescibacteria group bacterium]